MGSRNDTCNDTCHYSVNQVISRFKSKFCTVHEPCDHVRYLVWSQSLSPEVELSDLPSETPEMSEGVEGLHDAQVAGTTPGHILSDRVSQ